MGSFDARQSGVPWDEKPAAGHADATVFWTAPVLCHFATRRPAKSARGLAQFKTWRPFKRFKARIIQGSARMNRASKATALSSWRREIHSSAVWA